MADHTSASDRRSPGGRTSLLQRISRFSLRRRRLVIVCWLGLFVGCAAAGQLAGTKTLSEAQNATGSSGRGLQILNAAGLRPRPTESILVEGGGRAQTVAVAAELAARLRAAPAVVAVRGPHGNPALLARGGRDALVEAEIGGDPSAAGSRAPELARVVASVERAHPGVRLEQTGDASIEHALEDAAGSSFRHAELSSIPLTLVILVLAFGSLLAACVPLLLGVSSVFAALGASAVVSHVLPTSQTASSSILLIGLAVGVDYSLFLLRRERSERAAGRDSLDAIDVASATAGHAIVVSGATVIVSLAGLLLSGSAQFRAIAVGTMIVVAIAVLGSVTVLPAVLGGLGERVDRGRLPFIGSGRGRDSRAWRSIAGRVSAHPVLALVLTVLGLLVLAAPTLELRTALPAGDALPVNSPARVAQRAVERVFPAGGSSATIAIRGPGLDSPSARAKLAALTARARTITRGGGSSSVWVAPADLHARGVSAGHSLRAAALTFPLAGSDDNDATRTALARLRRELVPAARAAFPGAEVELTGGAAGAEDFATLMRDRIPLVIGFVLVLGFLLLVRAFGSLRVAGAIVALNLLSIGAAYGVMVAVFQHEWAQGLLGFTSDGAIATWLPLFAFTVLFGLSIDYTVLVVSRIREGVRAGLGAREATVEGVAATSGTVLSAAVVMVAVFSIFATLGQLEFKELGVGLGAAILLDALVVRGFALPATIALLAERAWGGERGESPRAAGDAEIGERLGHTQGAGDPEVEGRSEAGERTEDFSRHRRVRPSTS